MSQVFINRPIFAWVLAILVIVAGLVSLRGLPVEQYPDIAPVQVNIRVAYPGASAQTIENSVTQIIEQQLTGLDGLLYFNSTSSSRGQVNITATFAKGTDPDIAQVQVQNKVQASLSRLPVEVQQQGVQVTKSNADPLLLIAVYDTTNTYAFQDISDFLSSNIQDQISRVPGVGDVNVFGSQHAMRIWLDPNRLAAFSLMPSDVISAVQSQNAEIAAGDVGGLPAPEGQLLTATVTARTKLSTPEEFGAIQLKTISDGSAVYLRDVARIELGSENYNIRLRMKGHPGAGIMISLTPGADALQTAELVKAKMQELEKILPEGITYTYANDATAFIKLSVAEVQKALLEAMVLVVIVMFVFLQSWRATLIPAIAVPVVLLGTFAVFYMLGFTINTLTLFGMMLAIGLLVDDAIVVVENVTRLMEENPGMTAREATEISMKELQTALIAIALVLSAVFLPMGFFGGSTGVIYRQFAVTMISAMVLSVLVALILSPALTASLLKPRAPEGEGEASLGARRFPAVARLLSRARDGFNRNFDRGIGRYVEAARGVVDRKWRFIGLYAIILVLLAALFVRLPSGFLPNEDQGRLQVQWRLPAGATQTRSLEVRDAIEKYFMTEEKQYLDSIFLAAGGGGGGASAGQNTGQGFVTLVDWADRPGEEGTVNAVAQRAMAAFRGLRDAQVFVVVPGAVRGLGDSGFSMELQNSSGMSREDFVVARDALIKQANANPKLAQVRLADLPDAATLKIDLDTQRLSAYGLNSADVNSTLAAAWGGRYVNDFIDKGRVKRVYVQGDAQFRASPEDLSHWYVRTRTGEMAPFSAFSTIDWATTPATASRFQGVQAFGISGQPAPGTSSGEAMEEMERLASGLEGTTIAWSGTSYEERQAAGQAPLLYALSLLVVFLCLAALYESWSIPVAVILVIPLGLVGAVFAATLRGLENDVFLQIGLLTTMGLASKNAILMIEFAEQQEKKGMRIIDGALAAARLRLRPILMTSFAFIFGVLPLALSTGAGANSRIAIGTSVVGGMLTASLLAIFYIPLLFVLVRRGTRDALNALRARMNRTTPAEKGAVA